MHLMDIIYIIIIALALLVGIVIEWLICKKKLSSNARAQEEISTLKQEAETLKQKYADLNAKSREQIANVYQEFKKSEEPLQQKNADLEKKHADLEKGLKERIKELEDQLIQANKKNIDKPDPQSSHQTLQIHLNSKKR